LNFHARLCKANTMIIRRFWATAFILLLLSAAYSVAPPTEDYAYDTQQPYSICHLEKAGVGALTPLGEAFSSEGYTWPPPESAIRPPKRFMRRIFKMLLGMAHLLAAFAWMGQSSTCICYLSQSTQKAGFQRQKSG